MSSGRLGDIYLTVCYSAGLPGTVIELDVEGVHFHSAAHQPGPHHLDLFDQFERPAGTTFRLNPDCLNRISGAAQFVIERRRVWSPFSVQVDQSIQPGHCYDLRVTSHRVPAFRSVETMILFKATLCDGGQVQGSTAKAAIDVSCFPKTEYLKPNCWEPVQVKEPRNHALLSVQGGWGSLSQHQPGNFRDALGVVQWDVIRAIAENTRRRDANLLSSLSGAPCSAQPIHTSPSAALPETSLRATPQRQDQIDGAAARHFTEAATGPYDEDAAFLDDWLAQQLQS